MIPKAETCDPVILVPEIFRCQTEKFGGEISRALRNVVKLAIFLSFHKERFKISKLKKLKVDMGYTGPQKTIFIAQTSKPKNML